MRESSEGVRIRVKICIVLGVIVALLMAFWWMLRDYKVHTVYVEGNKHYSASEIRSMVETGWFGDNTIMLSLKYSNKPIKGVPFVETMDVKVED